MQRAGPEAATALHASRRLRFVLRSEEPIRRAAPLRPGGRTATRATFGVSPQEGGSVGANH